MPPRRLIPIKCTVTKEYIPSDRWLVSYPGSTQTGLLLDQSLCQHAVSHAPHEWIDILNSGNRPDKSFDLIIGPIFSHSAIKYSNIDHNAIKATDRITASIGDELTAAQSRFFDRMPRYARRISANLREHHKCNLGQLDVDWVEMLYVYADTPHPKRKLRLQAAVEIDNLGLMSINKCGITTLIRKVSTKLKRGEWAKPGKLPRNIIDLSCVGSLIAGFLLERLKKSLATYRYSNSRVVEFIPASNFDNLTNAFTKLRDSPFHFVYFSDDSCMTARCLDGQLMCNIDISSCDASLSAKFFEWVESTIPAGPWKTWFTSAVQQLRLDVTVRRANGQKFCTLKPNGESLNNMCLFSGSILTTFVDCYANLLIGETLSRIPFNTLTRAEAIPLIERTLRENLGFNVTVDVAEHFQQLQFLKNSPTESGEPWLNLATILRTVGVCKGGVIPPLAPHWASMSHDEKERMWNATLIEGMKYAGDSEPLRLLAEKFNRVGDKSFLCGKLQDFNRSSTVSSTDIIRRYNLTLPEYDEFISLVAQADIHTVIRCSAIDKIYLKDYGYSPPTHTIDSEVDISNYYNFLGN